jgi:hypothetical protein
VPVLKESVPQVLVLLEPEVLESPEPALPEPVLPELEVPEVLVEPVMLSEPGAHCHPRRIASSNRSSSAAAEVVAAEVVAELLPAVEVVVAEAQ